LKNVQSQDAETFSPRLCAFAVGLNGRLQKDCQSRSDFSMTPVPEESRVMGRECFTPARPQKGKASCWVLHSLGRSLFRVMLVVLNAA
jgi:hypothetical protein